MPTDSPDMSALHDFLIDAHILLTRAQECLQHLELIGEDADACDCLVATLASLVAQARSHQQPQIAGYCEHLRQLVAPQRCRQRLQGDCLPALRACLILLAWQLELIDPHTGQLGMDNQEQLELLQHLSAHLEMPAPCADCLESSEPCDHTSHPRVIGNAAVDPNIGHN